MAPVGWNVSAWSTLPEWCTRSRHGPSYAWWIADHDCQTGDGVGQPDGDLAGVPSG